MFRAAGDVLASRGVPVVYIDTSRLPPGQASGSPTRQRAAALASQVMDDVWDAIEKITSRLDAASVLPSDTERLLRIMKLTEEAGEVTQAVIGTLGQNPRKGVTHTWDDVQAELCDVMFTAMVALRTLTPDAPKVFDAHLTRVAGRPLQPSDTR
jgi:NTP pyrophosphatase (non-canonical NTP hydrolase)